MLYSGVERVVVCSVMSTIIVILNANVKRVTERRTYETLTLFCVDECTDFED